MNIFALANELEISVETARSLFPYRASKDWEKGSQFRIEREASRNSVFLNSDISDAMMDYMSESIFIFPLEDIIEIKHDTALAISRELGWNNQREFANKNLLVNTLQQAQTRHFRYDNWS